jgi:hypothetical protein
MDENSGARQNSIAMFKKKTKAITPKGITTIAGLLEILECLTIILGNSLPIQEEKAEILTREHLSAITSLFAVSVSLLVISCNAKAVCKQET